MLLLIIKINVKLDFVNKEDVMESVYKINDIVMKSLHVEKNVDILPEKGRIDSEFSSCKNENYDILYKLTAFDENNNTIFLIAVAYQIVVEFDNTAIKYDDTKINKILYDIAYPEIRHTVITMADKMGIGGLKIPSSLG